MESSGADTNKKRKAEEQEPTSPTKEEEPEIQEDEYQWLNECSISELKNIADERKVEYKDVSERHELQNRIKAKLEIDKKEGIPIRKKKTLARKDCPYLDTVNRVMLDFDFEKVCSVTLKNLNVYACLVCGKYFNGRGRNSQAYVHSLQANHHVFINLHNEKIYCLPDDYEVIDSSLADVKYYLNPTFTTEVINKLDQGNRKSQSLDGTEYLPGYVGFNNIKQTDYINVSLQALIHVGMLRNFFISEANYLSHKSNALVARYGELVRKVYNSKNFKSHVSPHEVLQAVSVASAKKFGIGARTDPLDFILFFLNSLHAALGGTRTPGSSIIHKVFQGQLEVFTEIRKKISPISEENVPEFVSEFTPFLYLSLDIPPPPLFKDELDKNLLPQIPIFNLLTKFDGVTLSDHMANGVAVRKKFKIHKAPNYLLVHMKRFKKNNFFVEKNTTIVNFPLKGLDFAEYLGMPTSAKTQYDLVANICHEGDSIEKGIWKVHIYHKGSDQWFEMQDLVVKPILPQLVLLSESYIQIYEKQSKD